MSKLIKYLGRGFILSLVTIVLSLILTGTAYACTLPDVSISSNPTYCSGSCNVTITWSVGCNPDNETPAISGPGLSSSALTGSHSVFIGPPATFTITLTGVQKSTTIAFATPTPAPATATPQPTAYPQYKVCNSSCTNNNECASGLQCIDYKCRLPSNPSDSSCNSPSYGGSASSSTPTPTKTPTGSTGSTLGIKTTATPIPTVTDVSPNPSGGEANVLSAETTPTSVPTSTPTPAASIAQTIQNHPIIATVVGVIVLGSVAFLIKFRKDLAVF